MVNTYPTQYRTQAPLGQPGSQRLSGPELALLTPAAGAALSKVGAANEALAARAAPSVIRSVAPWLARAGSRLIPGIGIAVTAYELYQLYREYAGEEGGPGENPGNPGGWTLDCAGSAGVRVQGIGTYLCGNLGNIIFFSDSPGTLVSANLRAMAYGGQKVGAPPNNNYLSRVYSRGPNTGQPNRTQPAMVPLPGRKPAYRPVRRVGWPGMADPMLQPIGEPVGTPEPIPYTEIPNRENNPGRSPVEQPTWGNEDPTEPEPFPGEEPTVVADPGGVTQLPPSHEYRPPRRREKERKFKATVANVLGAGVSDVLNLVTEFADLVDALYDALPVDLKVHMWYRKPGWKHSHFVERHSLTPQEKAQRLYDVFHELDGDWLARALKNVVVNEIQDQAIGRLSRGASGLNREVGRNLGIQVGPAL